MNPLSDLAEFGGLSDLAEFAPQLAQTFVSIASDIALIIDEHGVIRHVALSADPIPGSDSDWVGRPWVETVSGGTRAKIGELLAEAQTSGVTRRREVFHATPGGNNVPVSYSAIKLGPNGPVLAVGRDMGAVAAVQQRFLVAQREMEQDYWKLRQNESRYRQLFQVATDAVMIVDAQKLTIVEANRAAFELFGNPADASSTLVGQSATAGVLRAQRLSVEELLVMARTSGRPGEIRVHVPALATPNSTLHATAIDMSATPFRSGDKMLLLVRARVTAPLSERPSATRLADFVEQTPDAVTIADSSGRVLMANPAFIALCPLAANGPAQANSVVGRTLAELLCDPDQTLSSILAEAKSQGLSEQREASLGLSSTSRFDVEISAALLAEGDQECVGLTLRRIDQRETSTSTQFDDLASALSSLSTQLGHTSLPDLMRQISLIAERHVIEAALEQAHDEHQQAAHILGITVEDLWLRMHNMDGGSRGGAVSAHPTLLN